MDAALLLSVLLLERPGRRDRLCIMLHAPLSAWGTGELLGHFVRAALGSKKLSYVFLAMCVCVCACVRVCV